MNPIVVRDVSSAGESLNGWNALLLLACRRDGLAARSVLGASLNVFHRSARDSAWYVRRSIIRSSGGSLSRNPRTA
jgi:hypothetical protein